MLLWLLISASIVLLTVYLKYLFTFWERLGFPCIPATIPYGSVRSVLKQEQSIGELLRDIHINSSKEWPYLGIYMLHRPTLLIRDPELVKRILTTDFECFYDRGVHFDEETDPVAATVFTMPGRRWRDMRAKLSPLFSSSKLKIMFPTIEEHTLRLKDHLLKITETHDRIQVRNVMALLNVSIIGSVFFGFDLDTFDQPQHPFCRIGDDFFDPTILRNKLANFGLFICPDVLKRLRIPVLSPYVSQYVLHLVKTVMDNRKMDPSLQRKDFIQSVMEYMDKEDKNDPNRFTVERCAAQAFGIYVAGYETSASTTAYCLYELSRSPEWLKRAQQEVDELMHNRNGRIQYEDLINLRVVDMCIKESMRKYPTIPLLNRQCTMDYQMPGTDHLVPKGTSVLISVLGLQMDPKNYPNPELFDPSRFDGCNGEVNDMPFYAVSNW